MIGKWSRRGFGINDEGKSENEIFRRIRAERNQTIPVCREYDARAGCVLSVRLESLLLLSCGSDMVLFVWFS